mmetsp:Transcript_89626/g.159141  ORF Transcript_89626/g.159141 Transcript_89626/m.159141 type:complete len:130 (-) Transcript_89626:62-451(-)
MTLLQQFLLAVAVVVTSLILHGCNGSSDDEIKKAREEALKEGEAERSLSDAVSEYKDFKAKTSKAREKVRHDKDGFLKVLQSENRSPEPKEAKVIKDAEEVLEEASQTSSDKKESSDKNDGEHKGKNKK